MKRVLMLGAGFVSKPIFRYLRKQKDIFIKVADKEAHQAELLVNNRKEATFTELHIEDDENLNRLVKEADLVVSLVPYNYHARVAKFCLLNKKHMVTTSYVSPEMRQLDGQAKKAGLLFLNEIGLDPGIDHMSAMKIIHNAEKSGGKIKDFYSYCGGLPSPMDNNNPFGYKFSWSPKGVLKAGKNSAVYLKEGKEIKVSSKALFTHNWLININKLGKLETYANRDSIKYIDIYGLKDINTIFRGTLRNVGWCETMFNMVKLGLINSTPLYLKCNKTFKNFISCLMGSDSNINIKRKTADYLNIDVESTAIKNMEWLGLFENNKLPRKLRAPIDIMTRVMLKKMAYKKGEQDMVVLHHDFIIEYSDKKEQVTSTLVNLGRKNGNSAMSRTVSLPAAIAVKNILQGKIKEKGVKIPISSSIYNPVLTELEDLGIKFKEKSTII